MRAIVLAGGKGTRLAPYTTVLPKPLMPIGEMPIIEIVIRQLVKHGFDEVTLAVGHLAELMMAYCGDGSKFGAKITYSREDVPLGTARPIAMVEGLKETFLVMNGDLLTSINYSQLLKYHTDRKSLVTLAGYKRDARIDLGVIEIDGDNWVRNYIEKPTFHYLVSTGIYIFEPAVLEFIPQGKRLDLPDLVMALLHAGRKVGVYHFNGHWLDIGRHDDYEAALRRFEEHRGEFLS